MKRGRILVLEDEWLIADQIQDVLERAEFEVIGPSGRICDAEALVQNERPDAAVLDINVHGENSFSLARTLMLSDVPFLFLSGYSHAELPEDLRGVEVFSKPGNLEKMAARLAALLGQAKRIGQPESSAL